MKNKIEEIEKYLKKDLPPDLKASLEKKKEILSKNKTVRK